MSKKKTAAVVALSLAATISVAGTLAYLQDTTQWYSNTFEFTEGLSVTLDDEATNYKIIPGKTQTKNTSVTVSNDGVDSYCFVAVKENNTKIDGTEIVQYSIADGWSQIEFAEPDIGWESILPADTDISAENTKIFYREVPASDEEATFPVLKNNQVKYPLGLTKDTIPDGTEIKLNFAARVVQKEGFANAEKAWKGEEEALPNASMQTLDTAEVGTVSTSDGSWRGVMDSAVSFVTEDTAESIADKDYKNWICDFELSFNQDVNKSDVMLFGQYDAYSPEWLGGQLGASETMPAGDTTLVIGDWLSQSLSGVQVTYEDVVSIGAFNCGIAMKGSQEGLTATLKLVMFDNEGGKHVINEKQFPVTGSN